MARLATLAAIFAALLVAATAHRTTVTTMEIDDDVAENQGRGGSCREQLQRQGQLNHCRMFLMEQTRCGGRCGPGSMRGVGSEHLDMCCDQMRQMDEQCRCEGLREIVRRQQQGQMRGQEVEQMAMTARNLPQMCGLGPQYCEIRAIFI